MSENLLQQLRDSADLALQSQTVEEGVRHLLRAYSLFSTEAARLKISYAKLQERFDAVNRELQHKVAECSWTSHLFGNLLKHTSEAIFFICLDGSILMLNETGKKWFGEIRLRQFWDLFSDDHFGFSMREALAFGISHRLLYKTIESREFEISTSLIFEGPKSHHGLLLTLRDITEKGQLQQATHRADRMKELGEMAAVVAHEIRNPLGGIRGYASLLYRDLEKEKYLQEMASLIIEGTKALEKLVTTVLYYARPLHIELQSTELGKFLKQIGQFIKVDPAFPKNVKLEMHIPNTALLAPIDPVALKSALLNLIFNALHAMEEGGILTIALLKGEKSCQISISDTGIGMEEEMQKQLFTPFFTTKQKGNGLGLVEAQKIVRAHAGTIEVRSAAGKGTTFTLTLPLSRGSL